MNLYKDQFSTAHDFPTHGNRPPLRYIVASTPRSGSHRLGHALAATGRLGFPLEYLNRANLPSWEARLDTSGARETLAALWRIRTSPNGCFGLKLHYRQLREVAEELPPEELLAGSVVVRLRRRDLLGQAISLARARQTGAWISSQAPVRPASYDGDAIERALSDLAASNAGWDLAFARGDITPLEVTFEEIVADLDATVQRVSDHLGVAVEAVSSGVLPRPARQSDGINGDWRTRFLAEGRPLVSPPPSAPRNRLHRIARRLGATLRG